MNDHGKQINHFLINIMWKQRQDEQSYAVSDNRASTAGGITYYILCGFWSEFCSFLAFYYFGKYLQMQVAVECTFMH